MAEPPLAPVIPALYYPDAAAAIDWLCRAFGFQRRRVFADGDNRVQHAELSYGAGLLMLGTQPPDTPAPPENAGPGPYVVVADAAAHCERAHAQGAQIVDGPRHESFGTLYSCRDPQGQRWTFGDYDPWQRLPGEGG